jgi:23S rRNA (pseudouridine1915-N3)-methyltransferase
VRWRVIAVGAAGRDFYRRGCAHYRERLARLAPIEVREVKEGRGAPDAVRAAEAAALRARAEGRTVALDEGGRAWTSRALADHVSQLELRGTSRLTLWIGGAEGLDPALRAAADEVWRLSDLTLPHDLARLVLLEQLYRVEALRAGHPYHRG